MFVVAFIVFAAERSQVKQTVAVTTVNSSVHLRKRSFGSNAELKQNPDPLLAPPMGALPACGGAFPPPNIIFTH